MFQTRQFAQMSGVSVRTLHHYDRLGLLKPRQRTQAGYRLYEAGDLGRLEQIVALKYLGLSLKQIRTLLGRAPADIADALRIQRRLLEEKRRMLDRAIEAIGEAESQLRIDGGGSEVLRKVIEVIEMEAKHDWTTKYATEEARTKIEARRSVWSPELQERVSRQWNELIEDIERRLNEDPGSEEAQYLAARWNALVAEFTGRDKDIEQSVRNAWADRKNWPDDVQQKSPAIKPEVWAFIARANAVRGPGSLQS